MFEPPISKLIPPVHQGWTNTPHSIPHPTCLTDRPEIPNSHAHQLPSQALVAILTECHTREIDTCTVHTVLLGGVRVPEVIRVPIFAPRSTRLPTISTCVCDPQTRHHEACPVAIRTHKELVRSRFVRASQWAVGAKKKLAIYVLSSVPIPQAVRCNDRPSVPGSEIHSILKVQAWLAKVVYVNHLIEHIVSAVRPIALGAVRMCA
mmetsp:Transcript_47344/g.115296  ORF Transcript_47344/g.115296 Transcript_47344/m.115296 type:complete len:206 (-) Transcript_47344:812-1429(-)